MGMRRPPAVPSADPGPATVADPNPGPATRPVSSPVRPTRVLASVNGPAGRSAAGVARAGSAANGLLRKGLNEVRRRRSPLGWAALAWLGLALLLSGDLRPGLLITAALGYLLALWFFVARTRTLAWQSLAALAATGLPWALVAGALARALAPGAADTAGARVVAAAVIEQSLLLVPLVLLPVLFPARVRAFSVADWLLSGLALGAAAQAVEELARRGGAHAGYGPGLLSGGAGWPSVAAVPGRPVLGALVGVSIGLAVAAWRHAGKSALSRPAAIGWQTLAVLGPVGAWWLVTSTLAGWNAALVRGRAWAEAGDPVVPGVLRLGWRIAGHGAALGWLLLVLFLVALLVDAGRLRNAAEYAEDPLAVPFAPTEAADRWAARLTNWAGTRSSVPVAAAVWVVAAACAVVAYTARDVVVVLVAHSRAVRPGVGPRREDSARRPERESRWTATARGRAAGVMVRKVRAEAIGLGSGSPDPHSRRRVRLSGLAGLAALLVAAFGLGPHWAGGAAEAEVATGSFGPPGVPTFWIGGASAAAGPWWDGLGLLGSAGVTIAFLALLVIVLLPLDVGGEPGRSLWLAVRAPSGPTARERALSYLSVSGPAEVLVDAVSSGLGLVSDTAPGPLSKAATRREVRRAVQEFVDDPLGFAANRRAEAAPARPAPRAVTGVPVRSRTSPDRPAIKLADGRLLSPFAPADERIFVAGVEELARDTPTVSSVPTATGPDGVRPAEEYRARIYGDDERLVSLRPEKWSDGQHVAYGMVCDTVYYDGRGPCWYLPDTLPEPIRHRAELEIDRRLVEFATIVYYPASPFRALEITTNHPLVAHVLQERMSRLAIPGYVVLEP
jgi:hypothetical protein